MIAPFFLLDTETHGCPTRTFASADCCVGEAVDERRGDEAKLQQTLQLAGTTPNEAGTCEKALPVERCTSADRFYGKSRRAPQRRLGDQQGKQHECVQRRKQLQLEVAGNPPATMGATCPGESVVAVACRNRSQCLPEGSNRVSKRSTWSRDVTCQGNK